MISPQRVALAVLIIVSSIATVADDSWVVRDDGIGPVKIGMSLSEMNNVLHEKWTMPEDKNEQSCFYVDSAKHADIGFMILDGRLARIDVDRPGVRTAKGIQVGDSEARALRVYGPNLKVEPHFYTSPEGHYLTIYSSDSRYGIRFETDSGKINMFYAGTSAAISLVEGCS
jgi:hypothetical protein